MSEDAEAVERELALRAHERSWTNQDQMFTSTIDFGRDALKSATLTNGGAVVVGLAFVGSIYGPDPETARHLLVAVFIFALGSVACGVAAGFSYLSQFYYADALAWVHHTWEHPYVVAKPEHSPLHAKGDKWRRWAVFFVVLSYVLLLGGIVAAGVALSTGVDTGKGV